MSKNNQIPKSNYFLYTTVLLLMLLIAYNNNKPYKQDLKEIAK